MDDLMTTNEVALQAGVGPTAVKRWADAGLLRCVRTGGRHRRFVRADVQRFLRERSEVPAQAHEPWVGAILEPSDPLALQAFLLSERARLGAWHRVATRAAEALASIGELWRAGAVTIVEEHLGSERLSRALARLTESIPVGPQAPRALLACAEGDDHTLGLSLVELVLREAGWATLWAGRRTPLPELASALELPGVRMLAVSASRVSSDPPELRKQAEALARMTRRAGVALVLGGSGAWPPPPRHGRRFTAMEPFHAYAVQARDAAGTA